MTQRPDQADEVVAERSLLRHDRLMITGVLLAESLRVGAALAVPGLRLRCVHREDVSGGTTSDQPDLWTFIEFEAPSKASAALSRELSSALLPTGGGTPTSQSMMTTWSSMPDAPSGITRAT